MSAVQTSDDDFCNFEYTVTQTSDDDFCNFLCWQSFFVSRS